MSMQDDLTYDQMREEIRKLAHGRWGSVFQQFVPDVTATLFNRRNVTCPACGGEAKFYLADINTGAGHCASASCAVHGFDGTHTLALLTGERVGRMCHEVAILVGLKSTQSNTKTPISLKDIPIVEQRKVMTEKEQKLFMYVKTNAKPFQLGGPVAHYLEKRGLDLDVCLPLNPTLLEIDALYYADDKGDLNGNYPALVCPIHVDDELRGFHRIYLTPQGDKLPVDGNKRPTPSFPGAYAGGVIRLKGSATGNDAGIAEGVETALALICMGRHCDSVMNSSGLKSFDTTGKSDLHIYGDLDKSGGGQSAMLDSAIKNEAKGVKVHCYLPPHELWDLNTHPKGIDFLDALIKDKNCCNMHFR
jgi:hypothetical protein